MHTFSIYSQRKVDKDGLMTYVGEDAKPYCNSAGMFTADGLGGSASVCISEFDESCFEVQALSKKLYEAITNENPRGMGSEFERYVAESFSSLSNHTMRYIYENSHSYPLRLKKSGYVGSHALGSVMTERLIELESFKKTCKSESIWAEKCKCIVDSLLADYKNAISSMGVRFHKTMIDKLALFGTTLSGAFFWETEEKVCVIFVNCGDSRSYYFDDTGFHLTMFDSSLSNGNMSSSFVVGDDDSVNISVRSYCFNKPCTIMSMTDGIFGSFVRENGEEMPILLELAFLLKTIQADSFEVLEKSLQEYFDEYGGNDDSNSMVVAAFGYEDFDSYRKMAEKRLNRLIEQYDVNTLPQDFFTADYKRRYEQKKKSLENEILPLLESAASLPSVKKYCIQRMDDSLFENENKPNEKEIQILSKEKDFLLAELRTLIEENCSDFINLTDVKTSRRPFKLFGIGTYNKAIKYAHLYNSTLTRRDEKTRATVQVLNKLTEDSYWNCEELVSNQIYITREADRELEEALNNFTRTNKKLISKLDKDVVIEKILSMWLNEDFNEESERCTVSEMHTKRNECINRYREICKQLVYLERRKTTNVDSKISKYWKNHFIEDIDDIVDNGCISEDDSLKNQLVKKVIENSELNSLQRLMEKQLNLIEQYQNNQLLKAECGRNK